MAGHSIKELLAVVLPFSFVRMSVEGTWVANRARKFAEVWCCGRNDHGQCGTGSMDDKVRDLPITPGVEQNPLVNAEERKVLEWCAFSELLSPIQGASSGSMHTVILGQDTVPSHSLEKVFFLFLCFSPLFPCT